MHCLNCFLCFKKWSWANSSSKSGGWQSFSAPWKNIYSCRKLWSDNSDTVIRAPALKRNKTGTKIWYQLPLSYEESYDKKILFWPVSKNVHFKPSSYKIPTGPILFPATCQSPPPRLDYSHLHLTTFWRAELPSDSCFWKSEESVHWNQYQADKTPTVIQEDRQSPEQAV